MKMVPEIPLQQCYRVLIPLEGIRQDFRLEWNIYKFYNPFERLAIFFFVSWGYFYQSFTPRTTVPLRLQGARALRQRCAREDFCGRERSSE